MQVTEIIRNLLLEHDCVIVPGFGGFVTNYDPAGIDFEGRTLSPPSKSILFNNNLTRSDGLLVTEISRVNGMGYADAERMAGRFADRVREKLQAGKKYCLEEIGYFYRDRRNKTRFQAEPAINFLLDMYGMGLLRCPAEWMEGKQEPTWQVPLGRKMIYFGAGAAVAAALIFLPLRNGQPDETPGGLSRTGISTPETSTPEAKEIPYTDREGKNLSAETMIREKKYFVILGSFKRFGHARNMHNNLCMKGYNSRILIGDNGFFRVSAGTYGDLNLARVQMKAFRATEDRESAWILAE